MKKAVMKFVLVVGVVVALVGCASEQKQRSDSPYHRMLVGEWQVVSEPESQFIFYENREVDMVQEGVSMEDEINEDGDDAYFRFELDPDYQPMRLDIIMSSVKYGYSDPMKMIIEFSDENTIKVATNFNHKRPEDFSNEDEVLYLKRVVSP